MTALDLNGTWQLTFGPQDASAPSTPAELAACSWPTIAARVPGNVELDLLRAGIIEDPSVGDRIYPLREFETYRWWYRREFTAPALADGERLELVFEGLDCLGTVWLNGREIGRTDNMLIAHRFDVTDHLHAGGVNELAVRIDSPILAARQRPCEPGEFTNNLNWESLAIRKAPHMYGWDILPRLVSAGLWRGVHLEVLPPTRWRSVYWATLKSDASRRTATVLLDWDFITDRRQVDDLRIRITLRQGTTIRHQDEQAVLGTHGRAAFEVRDVDLWWPRGLGAPALCEATCELLDSAGSVLALRRDQIGLRAVELRRTEVTTETEPGEFVFLVNGHKVFAKGTNWVPLDALHSRDTQHLAAAVDMLLELNCNMVRCWGGNVYEDHAFFDLCDRHGIMVWQDFALACAIYPQDDDFAQRLTHEAEAVVTKLRHHPSLVLWAGNNEIDETYQWAGLGADPNLDRLSRRVLPDVVRRLDPARAYLPSSPYRGPELVRRGNERLKPEDHLWGPRDDFKGPYYTTSLAHFVSETGYHGCPERASLAQLLDPEYLWPWQNNEQWLTKAARGHRDQHSYDYRIPLMAKQIGILFGAVPDTLDDYVLASQISQAEAFKFFIERLRIGKWRRTGVLWWNLRDGWPIISDAVVDYYGRRKLAYAYIARVQQDVCILCGEPEENRHAIVAVNDTLAEVEGTLRICDADTGQQLLDSPYQVEPNGRTFIAHLPASAQPALWLLQWTHGGRTCRNHYLAGPRPFLLPQYAGWMEAMHLPPDLAAVQQARALGGASR